MRHARTCCVSKQTPATLAIHVAVPHVSHVSCRCSTCFTRVLSLFHMFHTCLVVSSMVLHCLVDCLREHCHDHVFKRASTTHCIQFGRALLVLALDITHELHAKRQVCTISLLIVAVETVLMNVALTPRCHVRLEGLAKSTAVGPMMQWMRFNNTRKNRRNGSGYTA